MKTITFTFSGDEAILNAGITSYAKAHGWTETVLDGENEIPNPISAIEFMKKPALAYFLEVVKAYNGRIAEQEAREQSDIATSGAMNYINFNIE